MKKQKKKFKKISILHRVLILWLVRCKSKLVNTTGSWFLFVYIIPKIIYEKKRRSYPDFNQQTVVQRRFTSSRKIWRNMKKKYLIDDVEVDKSCLSMINSEINKETPVNVKMLSETIGRNISSSRWNVVNVWITNHITHQLAAYHTHIPYSINRLCGMMMMCNN